MPAWNAQNIVYGRTFAAAVLTAYGTDPGAALVVTPKIRLSMLVGFNPQPNATLASLIANEIAFTGYTAGGYVPTFSVPLNVAPNVLAVVAEARPIAGTATPQVTGICYGWWLEDGANMIAAEAFPTGVSFAFNAPGDFLDLEISLPVNLLQRAG